MSPVKQTFVIYVGNRPTLVFHRALQASLFPVFLCANLINCRLFERIKIYPFRLQGKKMDIFQLRAWIQFSPIVSTNSLCDGDLATMYTLRSKTQKIIKEKFLTTNTCWKSYCVSFCTMTVFKNSNPVQIQVY